MSEILKEIQASHSRRRQEILSRVSTPLLPLEDFDDIPMLRSLFSAIHESVGRAFASASYEILPECDTLPSLLQVCVSVTREPHSVSKNARDAIMLFIRFEIQRTAEESERAKESGEHDKVRGLNIVLDIFDVALAEWYKHEEWLKLAGAQSGR